MEEEQNTTPPPPDDEANAVRKVLWLCAAFSPSVVGVACLHFKISNSSLFPMLAFFDLIFSVAGSIRLVRGMKNPLSQFFLGLFLSGFFFVLNGLIVLFVGCSGMGRIGP